MMALAVAFFLLATYPKFFDKAFDALGVLLFLVGAICVPIFVIALISVCL